MESSPENPYQPPAIAAEQVVDDEHLFNQRFRRRTANWTTYMQLGVLILVPLAMVAVGCVIGAYQEFGAWVWAFATIVVTCWSSLIVADRVITIGYASLATRLKDRLSAEGIKLDSLDSVFVQFSPAGRPYLYDKFTNWDVGFLVFLPQRIVYLGDRTRFALPSSQIEAVNALPGFDPRHPKSIYISWRQLPDGQRHVFSIEAGVGNSAKKLNQANNRLDERLRQWVAGTLELQNAVNQWKHLPPPRAEASDGKLFRQHANPIALLIGAVGIAGLPAWLSNLIAISLGVWTPDIMWSLAIGAGAGSVIMLLRGMIYGLAADIRRYPVEPGFPDD